MANIYLRKQLYDELVKRGLDPSTYVNRLVEKDLAKKKNQAKEVKK